MTDQERQKQAMILTGQAIDEAMIGRHQEALNLLNQALQLVPNGAEIYHNRGMVYTRMRRWREALVDFNRAIALSPASSSYQERGVVYYQMGDRQAARKDWEQALRMDPRSVLALLNLAMLCFEEQRYREVVDYCTRAIAVEPRLAAAYANRARAYLELGDRARALADMQKARDLGE